ncbi:MAG: hypothetical protein LBH00_01135 [Planctomycetaceae bacterium]|nr:hypothetical protein [Planctomycetaceae bacterium]
MPPFRKTPAVLRTTEVLSLLFCGKLIRSKKNLFPMPCRNVSLEHADQKLSMDLTVCVFIGTHAAGRRRGAEIGTCRSVLVL